ncbi:MAG: SH3 domain-containing protein [Anaerolineaceae bacterium]|nr:SH3 domain-containing protein [Anaerolineaceae bacterium]
MPPDNPAYVVFPLPESTQVYTFNADPNTPATLTLSTYAAIFAYTAEIRDSQGAVVATLNGSDLQGATFTIAPDSGLYEVVLTSENPAAQGAVVLSLTHAAQSAAYTQTAAQQVVVAESPVACSVSSATGENVLVYSGPADSYTAMVTLPPNMSLVTDTVTADGWYRVWFNGDQTGWISGQYIQLSGDCTGLYMPQPQSQPTAVVVNKTVVNTCRAANSVGAGVNVRTGPGMEYAVIAGLYPGTTVNVDGRSDNGWYQVNSGGRTGWVAASGVTLSGACDSVSLVWQVAAS